MSRCLMPQKKLSGIIKQNFVIHVFSHKTLSVICQSNYSADIWILLARNFNALLISIFQSRAVSDVWSYLSLFAYYGTYCTNVCKYLLRHLHYSRYTLLRFPKPQNLSDLLTYFESASNLFLSKGKIVDSKNNRWKWNSLLPVVAIKESASLGIGGYARWWLPTG